VMGTQIFYRIVVWLPLIIPAFVVGMVEAFYQSPSGLATPNVLALSPARQRDPYDPLLTAAGSRYVG